MERGCLALVVTLHHRFPGVGQAVGADWACAAADCYWPLLQAIDHAASQGRAHVITLAVSPSWTALASDPAAQALTRIELERRVRATGHEPWGEHWREILRFAVDRSQLDAVSVLRRAADSGTAELIPSPASWTWLPSLATSPLLLRAQVGLAAADHSRVFGHKPQGFWTPMLGSPIGLERTLATYGLRFYAADAFAFRRGTVAPPAAVLGPLITTPGVAAFGVENHAARKLDGPQRYANDPRYRDFRAGSAAAEEHADDFLRRWVEESRTIRDRVGSHREPSPPISIQELPASRLGGSWAFGARWLSRVLDRLGSQPPSDWRPLTLSHYIDRFPSGPLGRPGHALGHWWADHPQASVMSDRCRVAADALADVLAQRGTLTERGLRALAQMIRSLLLAQACDWESPPGFELSAQQGLSRNEGRFDQFVELSASLAAGHLASDRLVLAEAGPAFLPEIDFRLLDAV